MPNWVGQYEPLELFCLWTKVHLIFFAQRGKGCGWRSFFRCSICRSVPEIGLFAIKVESWQKSRRILDVLSPSQILGGCLPKVIPILSPLPYVTSPGNGFVRIRPISPEVLVAHSLNFKPNFKFSRLKFFWGDPRPSFVMCASKAWSICNACKNLRGSTPKGRNVVCRKIPLGWVKMSN